jgi:hypothetical protein
MDTTTQNDNATGEGGEVGKTKHDELDHSATGDGFQEGPLLGWFSLADSVKNSRTRPMKKSWIRKGGRQ